jgi:hypothetical protein
MGVDLAGTPYDTTGLLRPPATAVGVSAIRGLPNGAMRQYTEVYFTRGWSGVEHLIRTLRACGLIRPPATATDGYAVLDILDDDGDIVADYDLPTRRAFAYVYRTLHLRVVTGIAEEEDERV